MTAFYFNFMNESKAQRAKSEDVSCKTRIVNLNIFQQHFISCSYLNYKRSDATNAFSWNSNLIHYLKSETTLNNFIENCDIGSKTDLIPSVYEGGFKIWECTWDLVNFLKTCDISFKNKKVLDLGCGSGILGIVSACENAQLVTFHDYNSEVIEKCTISNVILNRDVIFSRKSCLFAEDNNCGQKSNCVKNANSVENLNKIFRFHSGDWDLFCDEFNGEDSADFVQFDVILSSETIYNPQNYKKLLNLFEKFLSVKGQILLASKTFYFGVGGNTDDFSDVLLKNNFQVDRIICNNEGVQREILNIKKKQESS